MLSRFTECGCARRALNQPCRASWGVRARDHGTQVITSVTVPKGPTAATINPMNGYVYVACTNTVAPNLANCNAVSFPMPSVEPVTRTILSFMAIPIVLDGRVLD